MRDLAHIWVGACAQVSLVAWNVVNLSQRDYLMAFVSGSLVSVVWWGNSRTAGRSAVAGGRWAYGFGAGCGTVLGLWIGGW